MSKYNCHPGEPLDMLAEECAELIQAIMKLRRFGPNGAPGYTGTKPTEEIKREVGDVLCSVERLIESGFMSEDDALLARGRKRARLYELFGTAARLPAERSEAGRGEENLGSPASQGDGKDLCPCERKGAVDPWCHAAGMCVDEPEEPRI